MNPDRMCADCGRAPGQTFWHSIRGPLLCLACAARRLAAAGLVTVA